MMNINKLNNESNMNRDIVTPIELPTLVKVREGHFRETLTGLTVVMIGNKPVYIDQQVDETARERAKGMGIRSSAKRPRHP